MNPKNIPDNHAIAVTAEGIIPIKQNDVVIVGIKCWIDENGTPVPFNESIQLIRKDIISQIGNNVFVFKRINIIADENSKPDSGKIE